MGSFSIPIKRYITRINSIVTLSDQEIIDLKDDEIFGIAMPPAAVVDYLKRICDFLIAPR